jgi:hypothetical protein
VAVEQTLHDNVDIDHYARIRQLLGRGRLRGSR